MERRRRVADLARHRLLAHNTDQWRLEGPAGPATVRIDSPLKTNSSEVVREAVIGGVGIALRSTWDVGPELRTGALLRLLPGFGGSRRVAIHAVYPSRRHLAQKVRVFIDYLADLYGPTPPWDEGLGSWTPPDDARRLVAPYRRLVRGTRCPGTLPGTATFVQS